MDNLYRISNNLREGGYTSNPHGAAADLAVLAGEYSHIMGQLEIILQNKADIWATLRTGVKSDTACERSWQATAGGATETKCRLRAKSIEKMMSALKSLLRIAEGEAMNLM